MPFSPFAFSPPLRDGSCKRDLTWYTWHIWYKHFSAEVGIDQISGAVEVSVDCVDALYGAGRYVVVRSWHRGQC